MLTTPVQATHRLIELSTILPVITAIQGAMEEEAIPDQASQPTHQLLLLLKALQVHKLPMDTLECLSFTSQK